MGPIRTADIFACHSPASASAATRTGRGEDGAGRSEEPPGPGVDEQPQAHGEHGRHRPAGEQHGADVVPLVVEEVVAEGEHVRLPPGLLERRKAIAAEEERQRRPPLRERAALRLQAEVAG
jgi:hypothetical protein